MFIMRNIEKILIAMQIFCILKAKDLILFIQKNFGHY